MSSTPVKTKLPKKPTTHPNMLDMVTHAITDLNERKGASVSALKGFIVKTYPTVDPNMLKYRLRKAIEKGMQQGTIVRPKGMEEAGAALTGRFRLDKSKMAAIEKAKQPKPKPKAKPSADKPKAKKPKTTEKAAKSPKKAKETTKKPKETKKAETKKKEAKPKPKKSAKSPAKKKPKEKAPSKVEKQKKPKEKKAAKTPKKQAKKK